MVSPVLNEFGNYTRAYRIGRDMLLYDMAKKIGCDSAFLSGCETDRHEIPVSWKTRLPKLFPGMEPELLAERIDRVNKRLKEGNPNAR